MFLEKSYCRYSSEISFDLCRSLANWRIFSQANIFLIVQQLLLVNQKNNRSGILWSMLSSFIWVIFWVCWKILYTWYTEIKRFVYSVFYLHATYSVWKDNAYNVCNVLYPTYSCHHLKLCCFGPLWASTRTNSSDFLNIPLERDGVSRLYNSYCSHTEICQAYQRQYQ